jgi:ubiquinone/menaquinone biosynthesis C-methylase UbiE
MLKKAEMKVSPKANINFLNFGVCDPELNQHIKENSIDYVVSMLVLCTIPNPDKALEQFRKWLKPDGKLIILEHIHAEHPRNKKIQNVINPAWRAFADGCNLNRNTDQLILDAGFKPVWHEYIKRSLRFVKGVYTR